MTPKQLESFKKRFWKYVKKTKTYWLWTGGKTRGNYGTFKAYSYKMMRAHRASLIVHGIDLMPDIDVCHSCDNPLCVNPSHLWQGTRSENMQDCLQKGRGRAKITPKDVRKIRAIGKIKKCSEIAKDFNLSEQSIYRIIKNKTWAHIKDES